MSTVLRLDGYQRSNHQLSLSYSLDSLRFTTSYWYEDVDLLELEKQHGLELMEKIYFHILAFEANKAVSLKPDQVHAGEFNKFCSPSFARLWQRIAHKVWGQWRYENDLPDYQVPTFAVANPVFVAPTQVQRGPVEQLAFCGGGKDSLVALMLLEQAGIPHGAHVYSHSGYGRSEKQHRLIDGLLRHGQATQVHRLWIYDDFLDSPVTRICKEYGVKGVLAAETPSSMFAVLPIVLQHGYTSIMLAHEKSADVGNLVWDQTGEEINHQWGKGTEAELLLRAYLREELIANLDCFSILRPLQDVVIFYMLRERLHAVGDTHSCNVDKPWCKRCSKCAYVWLNYLAYLPHDLVNGMFGENLLEVPENALWFRQMLGLEAHTPFECIGQIEEARLAFELCRRRNVTGTLADTLAREIGSWDVHTVVDQYTFIDKASATLPSSIADAIMPLMIQAGSEARAYTRSLLEKGV